MKSPYALLCLLALLPCHAQIPPDAGQVLVVTTAEWSSVAGTAQRFERRGPNLHKVGAPFPIVVGRTGMGWDARLSVADASNSPIKHEGDGRSPAGIFSLGTSFGYEASFGTHLPYLALSSTIDCVDDPASGRYNQLVDTRSVTRSWSSWEQMRREDELYHYGIVVNYNQPAAAGAGSCIFLHVWRNANTGTDGCTAMDSADIRRLMHWFEPGKKPRLVQMPANEYQRLRQSWDLPPLLLKPDAAGDGN